MSDTSRPGDWLGRKLLILGDVNAGKTTLSRSILDDFCGRGLGPRIAIVDLAPVIPPQIAAARGVSGVGGTLDADPAAGVLVVHPALEAPRLSSASEAEALGKAAANKGRIDMAWPFAAGGRDIAFLNDASIYLQAGTAAELIAKLQGAGTVVANGYFGQRLGGGELTRHERAEMERLRDWFHGQGTVVMLEQPAAGTAARGR